MLLLIYFYAIFVRFPGFDRYDFGLFYHGIICVQWRVVFLSLGTGLWMTSLVGRAVAAPSGFGATPATANPRGRLQHGDTSRRCQFLKHVVRAFDSTMVSINVGMAAPQARAIWAMAW